MQPAQSGRAFSSSWYQVSACERTLVKISAVDERSISSTTGCSICAPRWPPQEKRPGSCGSSVSTCSGLSSRPCTSRASPPWRGPSSALQRLVQVAQRGRQAPHHQLRVPQAQPRQRQLHLHAALVADELVPFVDDDHLQRGEVVARAFARQQQRQRFRRGHQRRGQPPVLPRALGRRACRRCASPRATAAPDRPAAAAAHAPCRWPGRAWASAKALAARCNVSARAAHPSHTA